MQLPVLHLDAIPAEVIDLTTPTREYKPYYVG